jgi:hypothetical protein
MSSCVVTEGVWRHGVVSREEIDVRFFRIDEQGAIATTDGAVAAVDWMVQ